jgi:hypothetical protein
MAEQNLLTDSQVLNATGWLLTNNSLVTANTTTAPDGTSTADTFTATGSSVTTGTPTQVYKMVDGVTGLTYTASIYAKANTSNFVYFREYFSHNAGDITWFNLSTGAVGTTSANHIASIVSVGNGWYRCVITTTVDITRNQSLGFGVSDTNNSFNIATTSSIYLWGAQFEQRSAVTAYTATTTQPITNYIPVLLSAGGNQARFDCNPTTGESLGLLIEEQRTNTQIYSSDFTNAVWNNEANRTIITANALVAPDGTLTADQFAATTENNLHRVYNYNISITGGTSTTVSFYAKRNGYDVSLTDSGGRYAAVFNLATGVSTAFNLGDPITASMVSVGNGWYRCIATITPTPSGNFPLLTMCLSDGYATFAGNGYSGYFIWGYQLEAGSFATSYIATTSASATRTSDVAVMTGANFTNWYNQAEGTLYGEAKLSGVAGGSIYAGFAKIYTDVGNKMGFYTNPSATSIFFSVAANSSSSADLSFSQNASTNYVKIVGGYKTNDFAASANASAVNTDSNGVLPLVNQMYLNAYDNEWNGWIKKIAYYPIRVSNTNLQALTS